MEWIMRPMDSQVEIHWTDCASVRYPQSWAVSVQCMVSWSSPSASVSLLTNALSYRRLAHASATCAPIDLADRRTWSVRE